MNTEGYTVFTGPLKHGPKGGNAIRRAEQAGEQVEFIKKVEHTNKHTLDGRHVAKILNSEEDGLRTFRLI